MTARAQSELDAACLALSHLKEPGIGDFNEETNRARAAKKWFGTARDEVLRKKWWNFATSYDTFSGIAGAAKGPLKNRYALPDDCLKVRFIEGLENDEWEVIGDKITSGSATVEANVLVTASASPPLVCYTRRVLDVKLWDPQFLMAFSRRLAELMAPEIGRSSKAATEQGEKAKEEIGEAASSDAREKAASHVSRDTSWVRARQRRHRFGR